jgi:hypothetical protein
LKIQIAPGTSNLRLVASIRAGCRRRSEIALRDFEEKRSMTMSKIVKLHTIAEGLSEEERLRVVAQRALAPPDFPFDGLHVEAAMILNQMRLAAGINDAQVELIEERAAQST